MKILRLISRVIIGLLFIFSGTVKAIDPQGSAYKFSDYFQAFNLMFLHRLALPLAILLFTAEFLAGLSVLSGYRQKTGIWMVMILMFIFTPLTFVLAVLNPVSDCGCFGDAVHLTNWQTFGKNIIILFLAIIVFAGRNQFSPVRSARKEWFAILAAGLLFIVFSLMNIRYLPLIDFLPYKAGTSIREGMKIPEGKPVDQYRTTFIYEKDGIRKEFTIDNYPANDSSWIFLDQRSVLVRKGYQPLIHDFSLSSITGENLTDEVLNNEGYTLLMISKKLGEADPGKIRKGIDLGNECHAHGIQFWILTSSGTEEVMRFGNTGLFLMADETTLKTMSRANPGYHLLKGGIIMGKWSWTALPPDNRLIESIMKERTRQLNYRRLPLYITTGVLLIMVLSLVADSLISRKGDAS